LAFIDKLKNELGVRAGHRDVIEAEGTYALREAAEVYEVELTTNNALLRRQTAPIKSLLKKSRWFG
jgi:hypothetical protein